MKDQQSCDIVSSCVILSPVWVVSLKTNETNPFLHCSYKRNVRTNAQFTTNE